MGRLNWMKKNPTLIGSNTTKKTIILKDSQQVVDFLISKNIFNDVEHVWICPRCGGENIGIYASHESPCGKCGKFNHPRWGRTKTPSDKPYQHKIEQLEREKEDIRHQITEYENIISGLENDECQVTTEIQRLNAIQYKPIPKS